MNLSDFGQHCVVLGNLGKQKPNYNPKSNFYVYPYNPKQIVNLLYLFHVIYTFKYSSFSVKAKIPINFNKNRRIFLARKNNLTFVTSFLTSLKLCYTNL